MASQQPKKKQRTAGQAPSRIDDDFQCPICRDIIAEAFVTKCGHSFCYSCLTKHLEYRKDCPSCKNGLTRDQVFPNFLLSKLIEKHLASTRAPAGSTSPSAAKSLRGAFGSNAESHWSVNDINNILSSLLDRKHQLETTQREIELELVSEFLKKAKQVKEDELTRVTKELDVIQADLESVSNQYTAFHKPADSSNSSIGGEVPDGSGDAIVADADARIRRKRRHSELEDGDDEEETEAFPTLSVSTNHIIRTTSGNSMNNEHRVGIDLVLQRESSSKLRLANKQKERVMKHFDELTPSYFDARLNNRHSAGNSKSPGASHALSRFCTDLYNFSRPSRLTVLAKIYYADNFHNPGSSIVSSIDYDRDDEYFATAGVLKKIKVFEFASVISDYRETVSSRDNLYDMTDEKIRKPGYITSSSRSSDSPSPGPSPRVSVARGGVGAVSIRATVEDGVSRLRRVLSRITPHEEGEIGASYADNDNVRPNEDVENEDNQSAAVEDDEENENNSNEDGDEEEGHSRSSGQLVSRQRHGEEEGMNDEPPGGLDNVPRYPVREMTCRSKISCLSWNTYIKAQLASSDYEGLVTLWDVQNGSLVTSYDEHEKRTWSCDFSKVDPTRLASGGDDSKIKIWSTNQPRSVMSIDSRANICAVKFNPEVGHQLAFGSADHNIHYYDLRNTAQALYVFKGHRKAVSYVKFPHRDTMLTASTDCTLRLWSLSKVGISSQLAIGPASYMSGASRFQHPGTSASSSSNGSILTQPISNATANHYLPYHTISSSPQSSSDNTSTGILNDASTSSLKHIPGIPAGFDALPPGCIRAYVGHTNEKNFVGLSVNCESQFIACGSETNSVFIYWMHVGSPVAVYKFGNGVDPVTGEELADEDPAQFVSSVAFRKTHPNMLTAANSQGRVKVLELV
ncbi:hypothetical protein SeLEV6574_g06822 [Synchytrium endobioticum]|uniref:RING-type domain-containing protein n=1 Tax=Synchytrium endobioticum TaxID=286115 RepID=A0A507CK17_9FUNG|nr:hypothetical protein SeLEV6574_g06822 [Synchytrium endobioticum]